MIKEEWVVTGVESLRLASDGSLQLFQASDSSLQLLASDSSFNLTAACIWQQLAAVLSCCAALAVGPFCQGESRLKKLWRSQGGARPGQMSNCSPLSDGYHLLFLDCFYEIMVLLFLFVYSQWVLFLLRQDSTLGQILMLACVAFSLFYFYFLLQCCLHVSLLLILPPGWHFWTHPGGRPTMAPDSPPASPSFRSNTPYFMFSTGHTCWEGKFTFEGIWVVAGQCDLNYIACF